MFRRVLIANRGEIAVRICRTLRDMGITSVAAYSESDRDALFTQEADEAYFLGPAAAAQSYLSIEALLAVAHEANVEAIHPGYGFLAENAEFAQAVKDAGMTLIGPSIRAMQVMGDKVQARKAVAPLGVPLVPGSPGPIESLREALDFADSVGYPVAVKASGGGGGRGIRVVSSSTEMESGLDAARREALAYFKNPEVYLERYYHDPRHVEIQVLGDRHGTLVHLGERDCSVQRRHQKVLEEAPGPSISRTTREQMGEVALRAARAVGYDSAGTVEFLLTREGEFYFLEMNTRIQVEHPVTECVTGVDLISEMVLSAANEHITVGASVLDPTGHAIEVRINAEDPAAGFRPTPGRLDTYREPGGIGIRVDTGVYAGYSIPGDYDSLLAKLIAWGSDREVARRRALRALQGFRIGGTESTIPFARAILEHPTFVAGDVGTSFVEAHPTLAIGSAEAGAAPTGADAIRSPRRTFEVEVNRKRFQVSVAEVTQPRAGETRATGRVRAGKSSGNDVVSPMHGTITAIKVAPGDSVVQDSVLLVVEAMKMENEIRAHRPGTVRSIEVHIGATVESGQRLAVIE